MHTIVFTGGGTGGHIYPGIAVADELKKLAAVDGCSIRIFWIGFSGGMDKSIIEKSSSDNGYTVIDGFYGIPAGKLRRYFSFRNIIDLFKIAGGFIASFFILLKLKPDVLFSKGGFVSVPPCFSARLLGIPVYTHECDFTPGLATRINSKSAAHILVSYKETESYLPSGVRGKVIVTGNPVRPVFYSAHPETGLAFLGLDRGTMHKPLLLVLGGSSGAKQINDLVLQNLDWLCSRFIVVHQTGIHTEDSGVQHADYMPYQFIYAEMPHVIAAADVVLSRAGANSLWECAVLGKPLVLIPLCGSGTRGDQVDNAEFFEKRKAALVLTGRDATSENLQKSLSFFEDEKSRMEYASSCAGLASGKHPAVYIAELIYKAVSGEKA